MLEIKEQETLPFEENNQPPEEINKYHKRIDDLIEDAEIEAEMEAEKKIRSKNSRMFSISMIGIGLLGLVYFQINQQSTPDPIAPVEETKVVKTETAEESLAKQVPVVEDGSSGSTLPVPQSVPTEKVGPSQEAPKVEDSKPKAETSKAKNKIIPPEIKKAKKISSTNKVSSRSKSSKPKSSPKKIAPVTKSERFYIQAGAFGVKENAELFLNQIKGKGFSPSIQTQSKKSDQYIVTVGNFSNTKSGDSTLKELSRKGFNASYYKNPKNLFSLKVGQFNSLKEAQKVQDGLSVKGFLSESYKAEVPTKTYIVQLGVFPSREKALLTQEKLARAGFPKTFLR